MRGDAQKLEAEDMIEADPNELVETLLEDAGEETVATTTPRSDIGEGVLVPRGGSFEGQVAIVGPTRIEGSVRGSLRGPGELFVGSEARVEGRVECEEITSEGEILGPVAVRTKARFGPGARLDGDLQAPVVVFDENAVWNGRAEIGSGDDPVRAGES